MNISKQTLNIVDSVLEYDTEIISNDRSNDDVVSGDKTVLSYIPHGINNDEFKPIDPNDPEFVSFKKNFLKEKDYDFIILFNNRNIRRKMVGELIADFKCFCDIIGKEKAEKVCLILKTAPIDNNGTNLYAVHDGIAPETNVLFAPGKYDTKTLNYIYNLSDVTMGISSAEGFGLATAESLMAGTPIIATVIGGLQDQMRFEDEKGEWISFDKNHPTNSDMKYKKHGE